MFAKTIVLSDAFLDMPPTARCLYFTLGMFADDDGFVNNPKSIMRQCGATEDDIKILLAKKFVLAFESGVIVIKHWRINNYLQKDRITPTKYVEEKGKLDTESNGAYTYKDGADVYTPVYTDTVYTQSNIISSNVISSNLINKNIPASATANADDCDTQIVDETTAWFTQFWSEYPKKKDKANAFKAFKKACVNLQTYETIMTALINQKKYWKDYQYIPYPSSWLNGKRWEDDTSNDTMRKSGNMSKAMEEFLNE